MAIKRETFKYAVISALIAGCCFGSLHASAYTADDIAAKARENNWPENVIQQCYNQWNSGDYTQEELDRIYESISGWSKEIEDFINKYFLPPGTPEYPPAAETDAPDDAAFPTVTKKDGTSEKRISREAFINMSLEEKQAYVDALDEASKQVFLASLSAEERNSFLRQLPAEDKAALMQTYIDVAGEMGVNVTVDVLTDNDLSLTIRDDEGTIIDKTAVGMMIDETGLSHTKPLLIAVSGTMLSILGFGGLYYYIRKTEE